MGRRKESVLPEPVCDCMNTSRAAGSSSVGNKAGNTALWIEVGLEIFILEDRCETTRGSRPRPSKVEESRGALLGFAFVVGAVRATCSIFGFEVKSEDMT